MQYAQMGALDHPAFPGPSTRLLALEPVRAFLEMSSLLPALALLPTTPRGDGHPVMTVPGFMADDASMSILRWYLGKWGYHSAPWRLGKNISIEDVNDLKQTLKLRERKVDEIISRLQETKDETGQKVSLVAWSLGGVMSRDAALKRPDLIRQIITLGSPFGDPRSVSIYRLMERRTQAQPKLSEIQDWIDCGSRPLDGVPITSIYSETDGFVAPEIAQQTDADLVDNICLPSSHLGLAVNPLVHYVVADRLAQAEDGWQPFNKTFCRRLWFK